MLGEQQLAWLLRELLASRAAVKIVASGSQWQTHGTEDSWASFRREREQIFQFIEVNNIEGVILLSGDRHFTAAYQVLGRFLEVSAGPVGSDNAAGAKDTPEEILKCNVGKLWCVFDIATTAGAEPKVNLEVWQAGGGMLERRAFSWDEINGRGKIAPSLPLPKPRVVKPTALPPSAIVEPAEEAPL
jgi:alkaline phosphatase D